MQAIKEFFLNCEQKITSDTELHFKHKYQDIGLHP